MGAVAAVASSGVLQARTAAFGAEQLLRPRRRRQDVVRAGRPPAMVTQRGYLLRTALVTAKYRRPLLDGSLHLITSLGQRPAGRRSNRSCSARRSALISCTTRPLS